MQKTKATNIRISLRLNICMYECVYESNLNHAFIMYLTTLCNKLKGTY